MAAALDIDHAPARLSRRVAESWAMAAAALCAFAVALTLLSHSFGYDRDVADMPVLSLVGILIGSGGLFAALLPPLVQRASSLAARDQSRFVALMLGAGLAARLVLFASEPMLEDDYQRYLWDGAVTAAGMNAYAVTPLDARHAPADTPLGALKDQAGDVLARVNHPALRTIYPPVAQAAFALANFIAPFSLTAWRAVLLACDSCVVLLLLALLRHAGRPALWAAVYWWNPLVLKEAVNSAHIEPLVLALVLAALWLMILRRPMWAVTALAFAAGAKLWPALLLPLVLRPLFNDRRACALALAVFAAWMAVWAAPIVAGGLGETSGFLAYAQSWQTNSALFPALNAAAAGVFAVLGLPVVHAALAVKVCLGAGLLIFALYLAKPPIEGAQDLMQRAAFLIAALVLVSPAQYPWYLLWLAPLLAFWPSRAFLLLGTTIPLYYASFYFAARETLETAGPVILALIWIPVWALIALDWQRSTNTLASDHRPAREGSA
jgi:alpha-1,6-mannosyltransferase